MEKNTNVPGLRFPEFEGEWIEKKLGEVTDLITKGTTPKRFTENGIKFIKIECFDGNKINPDKCLFIDEQTNNTELKRSILKENDILFAIAGATIGKVNIVTKDVLPANTNQALSIIRLKKNEELNFIYHNLKSNRMQKYIKDNISVGAQPNLNLEQMNNFSFYIPFFLEQTKIASFLTAADDKLAQLKKKKSLLDEYKKGVMQQIFSQELRFKDDNEEDFPEWEEKNGNLLFESISDKNHNSDLPILAITQEYGAIPRDLIDYNISVTDKSIESYKVVQKGDFIISLRSFQGGIEYSNYKGICSPAYIILRLIVKIDDRFYKFFFKTDSYIKSLNKNLEGIRDGKMISFKYFSEIYLPVPSLPEQTKIANFLSAIDEKMNHCSKQIGRMEEWKKGLLQQMFV